MAVLCAHALLVGVWSRPDACGGSPACLGARTQRVQQRAAPPPPPPPRGSVVPAAARDVHPGGRRSKLVNQRVAERRKRLKASFDAPAREELGEPSDPGFEARLTNAVNAAYGPGKLGRLIEDYGRVMTAYQLGCALALLAGSAAGRVARDAAGGLPAPDSRPRDPEALTARQQRAQERLAACRGYARRCATLLQARLEAASTLDCARAGYSLARLSLHDPALLEQLEGHTTGRLSGAPPEALAGLAVALALGSHRPSDEWLREWRVESFASLGAFNAQELANAAFALATWQVAPSDVWLARWAQVMRQRWGAGPRACPPPALVRAAYALAAMPAPEQVPVTALLAAQAAAASQAGATGEGTQAGSSAQQQKQLGQQQQQQQADRGRRGGKSSSGGGGSGDQRAALLLPPPPDPNAGRVPSFNWTCGFLGALRLAVDALAPGELSTLLWSLARLGHAPDLLFSAAWYRAAAARMGAFRPAELALALHALGALRPGVGVPGGVPGRFVAELLPAARALLPRCSGGQLVAVLWGLAELRLWPGQAWLDDWLAACEPQLASLDAPTIADAAWALARLGATRIPAAWVAALVAAVDGLLAVDEADAAARAAAGGGPAATAVGGQPPLAPGSAPGRAATADAAAEGADEGGAGEAQQLAGRGLADRAAAQARGFASGEASAGTAAPPPPPPPPGSPRVDARSLALLIWSLARLGRRPPRGWLLAFKATAEAQMGEEAARRLARFIAGALLAGSGPGPGGTGSAPSQAQAGAGQLAGSQL